MLFTFTLKALKDKNSVSLIQSGRALSVDQIQKDGKTFTEF